MVPVTRVGKILVRHDTYLGVPSILYAKFRQSVTGNYVTDLTAPLLAYSVDSV
jgi:hypothetical protein